jgi:hypothetical protein
MGRDERGLGFLPSAESEPVSTSLASALDGNKRLPLTELT